MATITNLAHTNDVIQTRTHTSADYCSNNTYFQIRTYAQNDINRANGAKQNIQITREVALELIALLEQFVDNAN